MSTARHKVFLDPDGTNPTGLAVIVRAPTGVVYASQCGGLATLEREAEGFLVLCPPHDDDGADLEAELAQWFAARAPAGEPGDTWPPAFATELAAIVARVGFWSTRSDGEGGRTTLALDPTRLSECMEAWVPVVTPSGPGVLTFVNSD